MTISVIKKFYVEDTLGDFQKSFKSLKKAVEFCIEQKNPNYLIHIGYFNLAYYAKGITYNELYNKCMDIIKSIVN